MVPKISIIMPVYNEKIDDLDKSIDAVLNQTYENFEYIIIDDNPNNDMLKDFLLEKSQEDSRIRTIFNKKNLKLAKTENKAIKLAKGLFIARIDADDLISKNRLEKQLSFIKKNNLDFCYSNFSIMNNEGELTRKYTYSNRDIVDQKKIKMLMSFRSVAIGPVFFFKKKVFDQLNGYRNMNMEDYDFITRALISGFRVGYQGEPLIRKRLRVNSISFGTMYDQYIMIRTIGKYLRKNKYSKVIPISLLNNRITKIDQKERDSFKKFTSARYAFNDKKNARNTLSLINSIIFSKIVFCYCVWSVFNKIID